MWHGEPVLYGIERVGNKECSGVRQKVQSIRRVEGIQRGRMRKGRHGTRWQHAIEQSHQGSSGENGRIGQS